MLPASKLEALCSRPVPEEGTESRTGKSQCDELIAAFLSIMAGACSSCLIWNLGASPQKD